MAIQLPNYQITQLPNPSAPPRLRGEIPQYYTALLSRYGPQNWWPARSRFEVIVGAYLTQNTNWSNVEKAMVNLAAPAASASVPCAQCPRGTEALVRPSGYFRQKARNLKTFIAFLDERYSGSLRRMFAEPTGKLRAELLELNGVGPKLRTPSCSMPATILSSSWTHIPAVCCCATASSTRKPATKKFVP